jgi:putative ABC transport system permease protein
MWFISLRDLQFRRRRFIIAIAGTCLVFAMSLALSGVAHGFRTEGRNTVDAIDADAWVVRAGVSGPFTGLAAFFESTISEVGRSPGVRAADPLMTLRRTYVVDHKVVDVNVIGHRIGGLGTPPLDVGRQAKRSGEAVASKTMKGVRLGATIQVSGEPERIVGIAPRLTYIAGVPNIYVPLQDAQAMIGNRPIATAIVTRGVPRALPPGLAVMSNEQAAADVTRPVKNGIGTIESIRLMLWIVAAMIIGAVVYMSALERIRDFAVLRAVGASPRNLLAGLVMQSVLVALVASALAIGLGRAIVPTFPLPSTIPGKDYLLLPVIALVVGVISSFASVRRAVAVDPALAFGGP